MLSKVTLLAAFTSLASAAAPANCSVEYTGTLGLRPASDSQHGPITYASTSVPHAVAPGLDGHPNDPLLVTQYSNGTAVAAQQWEFLRCSSLSGHAPPPGYQYPSSGPVNNDFGILRPAGQESSCLTIGSPIDNKSGRKNRLVAAKECTTVPARYRSWMVENYIYGENSYGMRLFYLNADDTAVVGNTTHKEVELITDDAAGDSAAMQLILGGFEYQASSGPPPSCGALCG